MLFGTDGVRGVVDIDVTSELAYNIGKGVALGVLRNKKNKKVIVGCDTRTSSDTLMSAICCGFSDYGINVDIVGIASTPSISYLVSKLDYSAGVMITASHNDNTYNGIKLFNEIGEKYDVKLENKVEKYIQLCNKKVKKQGAY